MERIKQKRLLAIIIGIIIIVSCFAPITASAEESDLESNIYLYSGIFDKYDENNNLSSRDLVTFIDMQDGKGLYFYGPTTDKNGSNFQLISFADSQQLQFEYVRDADIGSLYLITDYGNCKGLVAKSSGDVSEIVYVPYLVNDTENSTLSVALNKCSTTAYGSYYNLSSLSSDATDFTGIINPSNEVVGFINKSSNQYANARSTEEVLNLSSSNGSSNGGSSGSGSSGSGSSGEVSTKPSGSTSNGNGGRMSMYTVLFLIVAIGLVVLVFKNKGRTSDGTDQVAINRGENDIMPNQYSDDRTRICIRGVGGAFDGKKFELAGTLTIGRDASKCNICYDKNTKGISGVHCQLVKVGDHIEIMDIGSSYGTFVNGSSIAPNTAVKLNVGDTFYLANPKNSFTVYK